MIHSLFSFNSSRASRLYKTYSDEALKNKKILSDKIMDLVLDRSSSYCNMFSVSSKEVFDSETGKKYSIVYRKFINLYFAVLQDYEDNELLTLNMLNLIVDCFDSVFVEAKELDIIFNFEVSNFIIDEIILGGEIQEASLEVIKEAIVNSDKVSQFENEANKKGF